MTNELQPFTNAVIRCGVLLRTSNNWEDYQNMIFGENDAKVILVWLSENTTELPGSTVILKELDDFFRVLKTDWSIGINQTINAIQKLDGAQKPLLHRMIDEILSPAEKDDVGRAKAIEIIMKEI